MLPRRIADILLTRHGDRMYTDILAMLLEESGSRFGYFGYIDENGDLVCPSMTHEIWERCRVPGKTIVFPKDAWGGIWGRSLLEKRLIAAESDIRVPEGHIPIRRVLVCPIIHEETLIGQLALADKPSPYDEKDQAWIERTQAYIAPFLYHRLARQREEARRRQAQTELIRSEAKLHALSSQLLTAQEEERRRVAIELHDELGQALMVLKLKLRSVYQKLAPKTPELGAPLAESLSYIDEIAERVRRLSHELSPAILDDLGLAAAVRRLAQETMRPTNIRTRVELEETRAALSRKVEITLFRVFQEALTNILKHAAASRVELEMRFLEDRLSCVVADNGQGFEPGILQGEPADRQPMGLTAMAERIRMVDGDFDLQTRPGQGTRICFSVPLDPEEASRATL